MRKIHLTPEIIFKLYNVKKPEKIDFAFSFDYKNLALKALACFKNPEKIINFSGLVFWQTDYKDKKIVISYGGSYAPDTAIGTELLCFLGAKKILRIGLCGGLKKEMEIGDLIVADAILDYTGVTKFYPAKLKISLSLNERIKKIFKEYKIYCGKVCSSDALFRETKDFIKKIKDKSCIAIEMALSSFFKVASFYKKEASSLLVVSDNLITQELGFREKKLFERLNIVIKKILQLL